MKKLLLLAIMLGLLVSGCVWDFAVIATPPPNTYDYYYWSTPPYYPYGFYPYGYHYRGYRHNPRHWRR